MAELKFLGPAGNGNSSDIVTLGDVTSKKGAALTSAQIDSQISTELTGYSLKTYVDQQDAPKALTSYVNTQDNTKLLKSTIGAANGAVPLDGNGKIPAANLTTAPTVDAFAIKAFYTPSSYTAGSVTGITTQVSVKMCADIVIPDPGYPYHILPFGYFECAIANGASVNGYPEIQVRVGSRIIGWGAGGLNIPQGHPCNIFPYPTSSTPFTGSQTVTCYGGRNAPAGASSSVSFWIGSSATDPLFVVYIAAAK